tara:strand:+ start:44085 stop:44237 length:153 start_codon:yes stop_codon:yes gene_type:complete
MWHKNNQIARDEVNGIKFYLEIASKKDHIERERLADDLPANPVRPGREQP